ncbi:MAG: 23S rRNA (adenine(2503)-C(2))-methyltransferase RlmN [Clostridia bacterium]|nr:23S rRNA (adenine(2503)-C(2))-methyltransferase RlmN [Clostridia bacterium]
MGKVRLKDLTFDQLTEYLCSLGLSKFRGRQVFEWLYKGVTSFDEMTNLSKDLRTQLDTLCEITSLEIVKKQVSSDGTIKYLFRLEDGETVESVLMDYKHGHPICISTQVGCNMGCKFCASTIGGKVRDLSPGEIIDQILFAQKDSGVTVSNIVLMGIGEPLDNYDSVMTFIRNANHYAGLNIGARHISVSTCGLTHGIDRLAEEDIPVTLSVSLHAPNDELRNTLMPVNKKYPIKELMKSIHSYIKKTNRRVTFEYSMIDGVNDGIEQAKELLKLTKGMLAHINLIPVNKVKGKEYSKSNPDRIEKFRTVLEQGGVTTTVRRSLGSDIEASCGQLRRENSPLKNLSE